jgi:hypothetical protein
MSILTFFIPRQLNGARRVLKYELFRQRRQVSVFPLIETARPNVIRKADILEEISRQGHETREPNKSRQLSSREDLNNLSVNEI